MLVPHKDDESGVFESKVYYAVFAENNDITYTYGINIDAAGIVTSASESIAPATGIARGSQAIANKGFYFLK